MKLELIIEWIFLGSIRRTVMSYLRVSINQVHKRFTLKFRPYTDLFVFPHIDNRVYYVILVNRNLRNLGRHLILCYWMVCEIRQRKPSSISGMWFRGGSSYLHHPGWKGRGCDGVRRHNIGGGGVGVEVFPFRFTRYYSCYVQKVTVTEVVDGDRQKPVTLTLNITRSTRLTSFIRVSSPRTHFGRISNLLPGT